MGKGSGMSKVVFFADLSKLHEAISYFNMDGFAGKRTPVKLHMGEMKNPHYPPPDFVKMVVDEIKCFGAEPFLFDTPVAYPGLRSTKAGYEKLAKMHGFSKKKIGCDVIVGDTGVLVTVENRVFDVATQLFESTHIVAVSHVKGHIETGFGGAIKNFGMGGITKETKKRMHHDSRPVYTKDACTFCGVCAEVCPFDAIKVSEGKRSFSDRACFGCGVCVDACKNRAIKYVDTDLQYLLALAAYACIGEKNVLYINELRRMAGSCDCDPFPGQIIVPDIGFLVSTDPVAIDKASLDLINDVKENVFQKENGVDPSKQIKYGEEIGLGSASYQLIEL
jgi:uncharacterized Fe-S center protein